MNTSDPVKLTRDVQAIAIPAGTPIFLPAGTDVYITQSLGGSHTVVAPGVMARINAKDADALGLDVPESARDQRAVPAGPVSEDALWDALKNCYDPEIPVNIVDLGLVYDCKVTPTDDGGNKVDVKMTLTAPGCGMGGVIASDAEQRIREVPGVTDVHVEVVWDPIWNQSMMSDAARLQLGLM
ncbi:MAG TPA: putative Fe-S cluster assembly protein SufT [Methylomirabilota bacterium]|nr:putative Fe-S cluster assembly protein SufT [Methylomirabilota bacterium]